jgi:hypothetical protein
MHRKPDSAANIERRQCARLSELVGHPIGDVEALSEFTRGEGSPELGVSHVLHSAHRIAGFQERNRILDEMYRVMCKVCSANQRGAIDRGIVAGKSLRMLARSFGVSRASVQRHAANHVYAADETLAGNSEEALRARGDLALLLVRGALTPVDIARVFAHEPLQRTIQMDVAMNTDAKLRLKQWRSQQSEDIPELPAMPNCRALVYHALYRYLCMEHLVHLDMETVGEVPSRNICVTGMRVLERFQKEASITKLISGCLVSEALKPWMMMSPEKSLRPRQFQEARTALSLYLHTLHSTLSEYLCYREFNEAVLAENRRKLHLRFAQELRRKAAQRLVDALELHEATRTTMRNLRRNQGPPKDRNRTPLSEGEKKIVTYVFCEPLDAPLPSLRENQLFIGRRNA